MSRLALATSLHSCLLDRAEFPVTQIPTVARTPISFFWSTIWDYSVKEAEPLPLHVVAGTKLGIQLDKEEVLYA